MRIIFHKSGVVEGDTGIAYNGFRGVWVDLI